MCGALDKPCSLCQQLGHCVCGWHEDEFSLCTKNELIERLHNPKYAHLKNEILSGLKDYYNYHGQQFWIVGRDNITCPLCKAEFNDEIYYILRGNSELKYCPNCGERIYSEVTEN